MQVRSRTRPLTSLLHAQASFGGSSCWVQGGTADRSVAARHAMARCPSVAPRFAPIFTPKQLSDANHAYQIRRGGCVLAIVDHTPVDESSRSLCAPCLMPCHTRPDFCFPVPASHPSLQPRPHNAPHPRILESVVHMSGCGSLLTPAEDELALVSGNAICLQLISLDAFSHPYQSPGCRNVAPLPLPLSHTRTQLV